MDFQLKIDNLSLVAIAELYEIEVQPKKSAKKELPNAPDNLTSDNLKWRQN